MIVARVTAPVLLRAVCAAAHPEEDVVTDTGLAVEAIGWGFPRLVVRAGEIGAPGRTSGIPVLDLDDALLRRWEAERRMEEPPVARVDHMARRLRTLMDRSAAEGTWVDGALADLTRAAGAQLPLPLRAFARRILEFPVHYTNLHALAGACHMTRGALKATFRRRELPSPFTYLRWFRTMAVAHLLSDRSITVATAARRLRFTSDGNLCRMMAASTGLTPTEVRTVGGWNRLIIGFALAHLTPEALDAWAGLDELFQRRVA